MSAELTRGVEFFADKLTGNIQISTLRVFLEVARREGCVQKDIECWLELTNASASRNVRYWVDRKLMTSEEDPRDRRYKTLRLTPAGRDLYAEFRAR